MDLMNAAYEKVSAHVALEVTGFDEDAGKRIREQVYALLLARKGTIPGSRGFGLEGKFLDLPPREAANQLAVELQSAARQYIPEINIVQIREQSDENGRMIAVITIEGRRG